MQSTGCWASVTSPSFTKGTRTRCDVGCRLEGRGLVLIARHLAGEGRGRPEGLVSLREEAVELLRDNGVIRAEAPRGDFAADRIRCLDHLLLANDFRVQLAQVQRIVPALAVQFLSPLSLRPREPSDDRPLVHERFRLDDDCGSWVQFTPDGVFSITHSGPVKALLFFLEVDMGTEALASPRRCGQDVRQKIVNYQAYFRLRRYKRYERIWGCRLRGFRLLFLAHSAARKVALCRLVREMPPSGFIWLTDRGSLLSQGVWAPIWAQGGRLDLPPQSILGSQAPGPAPCPADLG